MTQLTQEEIRDALLSLYEENEQDLSLSASEIEKIEDEGFMSFERKVIAIKNRLVSDESVSEEDLQKKYLEDVEIARKEVLSEVEKRVNDLLKK